MKKLSLISVFIILAAFVLTAQVAVGEPNPAQIGVDTAQQSLKEISVNKFEDLGFWTGAMPRDHGIITLRRHEGGPMDKELIQEEVELGIVQELEDGTILGDQYVLGAKVEFYRRAVTHFDILPSRPLPVEGITKTLSIWVVGRNTNHELSVLISDFFGRKAIINIGKLNFIGWRKLTVAIPPSIVQRHYHYADRMGINIEGFRVSCNLEEAFGTYYIYFDDLRAVTDLFAEETRDADDMLDAW